VYTCEQALVWICAVVNQKGGVGKTAVTLGLASALRQRGRKVLVVDMDPQANAIAGLGVTGEPETLTIGDALAAAAPGIAADDITATGWGEAIACIPADVHLAEREQETAAGHEFRLRRCLDGVDGFDVGLIDCPPSIGELVTNALVAASAALIVTQADVDSLLGVAHVLETIDVVRTYYNHDLEPAGIVVNALDLRAGEQRYRVKAFLGLGVPYSGHEGMRNLRRRQGSGAHSGRGVGHLRAKAQSVSREPTLSGKRRKPISLAGL